MQGIYYTKFLRVASDLRQLKAQVLLEGAKGGEGGVIAPFCAVCFWRTDAQSDEGRGFGGRGGKSAACLHPTERTCVGAAALHPCFAFSIWARRFERE